MKRMEYKLEQFFPDNFAVKSQVDKYDSKEFFCFSSLKSDISMDLLS